MLHRTDALGRDIHEILHPKGGQRLRLGITIWDQRHRSEHSLAGILCAREPDGRANLLTLAFVERIPVHGAKHVQREPHLWRARLDFRQLLEDAKHPVLDMEDLAFTIERIFLGDRDGIAVALEVRVLGGAANMAKEYAGLNGAGVLEGV